MPRVRRPALSAPIHGIDLLALTGFAPSHLMAHHRSDREPSLIWRPLVSTLLKLTRREEFSVVSKINAPSIRNPNRNLRVSP